MRGEKKKQSSYQPTAPTVCFIIYSGCNDRPEGAKATVGIASENEGFDCRREINKNADIAKIINKHY